ncbi:MAG: hypothetical protein AAGU76_11840 [Sedimentibacter sp.]|uniref:hypothetical protein n=1 Tax=Sedimentibacter sp. TaxID=1960295 RepID=UPI003158FE78
MSLNISPNMKAVLIIFCGFFAIVLLGVGLLMRKFDFSCMFINPFGSKDDGLYARVGFKVKKIAEDTPENRKKYSMCLGNFLIIFAMIWLLISVAFIVSI